MCILYGPSHNACVAIARIQNTKPYEWFSYKYLLLQELSQSQFSNVQMPIEYWSDVSVS